MAYRCLRADVSYFLCCTRKRDPFPRATKEIGDVCAQARPIVTIGSLIMFFFFSEKSGHGFRLFTVPYFFARSFRYTASYRHGYLDFQMYRGGGRRGL